jgi:outer membrane protein
MNKLLLVCLLAFAPVTIASADIKIAVIDLSKAFDQFYKTKDAQAKLKEKQDGYQKEIQDRINDYEHMAQDAQALDTASKDPTLSPAARADKSKALDAKKQDLLNMQNQIQEMKTERGRELQEELLRRHKEIVDEITKVVSDYSGPQGYDLVIDKSTASAGTGVSIVLYNSSKLIDITDTVIKMLNASAPPPGTIPAGTASSSTDTPAAPAPSP